MVHCSCRRPTSTFGYVLLFLTPDSSLFESLPAANRPYGIFQQPNVMASFLATGLCFRKHLLARRPLNIIIKLASRSYYT
ncbi:pilin glycosylation ligase domain-containing protein [Vibrio lentus]|nr:pilin glycosylation ligase domain-containing protein [Vibrio lentus]